MLNSNQQLIEASKAGDTHRVQQLINDGADVNHDDITSFLWAYFNGHKDIVRLLLSNGGNVNHDHFEEGTLLTFAALWGDVDFIEYLISVGAVVDHPMPNGGQTALHHAANQDKPEAARALLRHGANPNHKG